MPSRASGTPNIRPAACLARWVGSRSGAGGAEKDESAVALARWPGPPVDPQEVRRATGTPDVMTRRAVGKLGRREASASVGGRAGRGRTAGSQGGDGVFLTGATGFVGMELLVRYLER